MNPLNSRLPIPKDLVINFAGMVFLGCALFLFWTEAQLSEVFSMRGLIFLFLGLVLCGLVIGWPITQLHRRFSYRLLAKNGGETNETSMQIVRFTGTALMLAQVLGIYYLAQIIFFSWPVVPTP